MATFKPLKDDLDITIESLSQKAGIATSAVKKQLRQMMDKGYIERRCEGGAWYVFASPSV